MMLSDPDPLAYGLLENHLFSCPLTMRGGPCDGSVDPDTRRASRTELRHLATRRRADDLEDSATRLSEHGRDDIAAIARHRAEDARASIVA